MAAVAPPTYESIREPGCGASFPHQALAGSKTALCLFTAAFFGRQDVFWIAEAGLTATCVDVDAERLGHMERLYPDDWEWAVADVFLYAEEAQEQGRRWDVVTLDAPSNHFQTCADMLPLWVELARKTIMFSTGNDTKVVAPKGWKVTEVTRRSNYLGGVFWTVLTKTPARTAAEGEVMAAKQVEIARRGLLGHKWGAKFIAVNGEVLVLTPARQTYHNLGDLKAMLATYFPDWPVHVISREKP